MITLNLFEILIFSLVFLINIFFNFYALYKRISKKRELNILLDKLSDKEASVIALEGKCNILDDTLKALQLHKMQDKSKSKDTYAKGK